MGMKIGIGLGLTRTAGVGGGGAVSIAAPLDVTWIEDTNPPEFALNLVIEGSSAVQIGDVPQIRFNGTGTVYSGAPLETLDGNLDFSAAGLPTVDHPPEGYAEIRFVRGDIVGEWSSQAIYYPDPVVPSAFTSGMWSVADLASTGDARVTVSSLPSDGGSAITSIEYRINGGTWTSSGLASTGTFDIAGLTDGVATTVELRAVNAAGNGPDSDDKTVTTTGTWYPSSLGSDLALWLEADDLSSLFKNVAGSSAVSLDGDAVGAWNDKSGGGFHLTAAADDTTRPTYKTDGGAGGNKPYVQFDGVDDVLRRLADLGIYAAGTCSVFLAVRGNPATLRILAASGSGSSNNPVYMPMGSSSSATAASFWVRDDAFTEAQSVGLTIQPNAFDNTDNVYGVVDDGSSFTPYLDGVAGTPDTYTRSGTLTLNRFGLGALVRTSTASYFNARIYALVIVKRVLTSGERASLTTFLGAKMGRVL